MFSDKQGKQHFLEVSPRFQNGESTSSGESTVSNIFSSSGSTCRKAKSILFKLEKTNTRSKYFKHNTGLRDTFSRETLPKKLPNPQVLNHEQSNLVKEVKEMLLKGAIQKVTQCRNQYISNLFLISKKDGGITR